MKLTGMMAASLVLVLASAGCATKNYVAKTVAPIEQRVGGTENKNAEQDKTLAMQEEQLNGIDRDVSQTKERLGDVDAKATQAGDAAKMADQKAVKAQDSADQANQAATNAHTFAEEGLNRLNQNMDAMNNFQMTKSEAVLFGFDQDSLTAAAKEQLDALGNQAKTIKRYVIEVQGFTDKTGPQTYNETLSERRAAAVARYLANQFQIPVRAISILGSGYALPVADDSSPEGRKMNRRVEVRLWVPENESTKISASNDTRP
jgi:outer membrane protein OmpA-like peptidoglycan-associated protein